MFGFSWNDITSFYIVLSQCLSLFSAFRMSIPQDQMLSYINLGTQCRFTWPTTLAIACLHYWPVSSLPAAKDDNNKCAVSRFHFSLSRSLMWLKAKRREWQLSWNTNEWCQVHAPTNKSEHSGWDSTPDSNPHHGSILRPPLFWPSSFFPWRRASSFLSEDWSHPALSSTALRCRPSWPPIPHLQLLGFRIKERFLLSRWKDVRRGWGNLGREFQGRGVYRPWEGRAWYIWKL